MLHSFRRASLTIIITTTISGEMTAALSPVLQLNSEHITPARLFQESGSVSQSDERMEPVGSIQQTSSDQKFYDRTYSIIS